jgi:hypothetical protein
MTRVKFIMFKGELVALFPDEIYNASLYGGTQIMSYMKIGQHGPASSSLLRGRYATPEQYEPLLRELRRIGYDDLEVMEGK